MKKVILVRHGKSSWADPDLDDHDRPLNPRGRRAAPAIARWLDLRGHRPNLVLCSSSLRTRQTFDGMAAATPTLPEPRIEPGLYHAAPDQIRARLADLADAVDAVMVIGHNPGLSALTRQISNGRVRPRCARAFEHFPTAAAAVFVFHTDAWAEVTERTAEFVDFALPRELEHG
ncbi:MAG: histidine phosphatase family protein [Pikeienuella sp.]